MSKGTFIIFTGVIGSGKSTQIQMLKNCLEESGNKTKVLNCVLGHTSLLIHTKRLFKVHKEKDKSSQPILSKNAKKAPLNYKTWLYVNLSLLDLVLQMLRVRLLVRRGVTVICERYQSDSEMYIATKYQKYSIENWALWKLAKKLTPQPDLCFLISIDPETAQERIISRQENLFIPDQETLLERCDFYEQISQNSDVVKLDGKLSTEKIQDEIQMNIFSKNG